MTEQTYESVKALLDKLPNAAASKKVLTEMLGYIATVDERLDSVVLANNLKDELT